MRRHGPVLFLLAALLLSWLGWPGWPALPDWSGSRPAEARPATPQGRGPQLRLWDRVLKERWEKTQRLLEEADDLLKKRQYAAATARLNEAIRMRPQAPFLWFALGTVHSFAGKYDDCVKALTQCRAMDPKLRKDLVAFRMALCLSLSGRVAAGIAEYQKVGSGEVSPAILHWNLGDNFMALGRLDEAHRQYEAALMHAPGRAVLHLALAVVLHRQGKRQTAERRARLGLRLDPRGNALDSSDILWLPAHDHHYYRAVRHLAASERGQALAEWQQFLRADPRSPWRHAMDLSTGELRARPLSEEDIRREEGSLDRGRAAALLTSRLAALSRCLGAASEPTSLFSLRSLALVITLSQGRMTTAEVKPLAGELPAGAAGCLQSELNGLRWTEVASGRDTSRFSVELIGP